MSEGTTELIGILGTILALVLSIAKWGHIGWAILHGCLGWIYVIYYVFQYGCIIK